MPSALRVRLGHVLQVIVSRVPRSSLHSYSMILSTVQLPLLRKLTISNGPNSDKASRIFYLSFDHWRERTDGEREMICRVTSIQGFWNRASVPWIEVSHHVFFVDRVDVLEFSIASPPIENNFSFHVPDFFTSSSPLLINRSLHWPDEISPRKFLVNNNEEIEIHVDMILFTLYLRQVEVISVHQRYPHWVSSVVQVWLSSIHKEYQKGEQLYLTTSDWEKVRL